MADDDAAGAGARASSLNEPSHTAKQPPPLPPKPAQMSSQLPPPPLPEKKPPAPSMDEILGKPVNSKSFFGASSSSNGNRHASTSYEADMTASMSAYAPPTGSPPSYEDVTGFASSALATGVRVPVRRRVPIKPVDTVDEIDIVTDDELQIESSSSNLGPDHAGARRSTVHGTNKYLCDDLPPLGHPDWQSLSEDNNSFDWRHDKSRNLRSWERQDATDWGTEWYDQPTPRVATPWSGPASAWTLPGPAHISEHAAARERGKDGFHEFYDVGWTAPKIVECEMQPQEKGGIWKDVTVWDFEVDTPPQDDDKYQPLGTFVPRGPTPGLSDSESTVMDVETATGAGQPQEVDLIDLDGDAQAEPTLPAATSSKQANVGSKGYSTVSKAELDAVRPHPDLYFCRKTMSWVLFTSVEAAPHAPIRDSPTLWQRSRFPFDEVAPKLPAPLPKPFDLGQPEDSDTPELTRSAPLSEAQLYALFSTRGSVVAYSDPEFYPLVIPRRLWYAFETDRKTDPPVGVTPSVAMYRAVNLIWMALDNILFKGEIRALPVTGKNFAKWMTWNHISQAIFVTTLGFTYRVQTQDGAPDTMTLHAPNLDERTEDGKLNRARCLRCWLELGLWIADCKKKFSSSQEFQNIKISDTRVKLKSARKRLLQTLEYENNLSTFLTGDAILNRTFTDPVVAREYYDFLGVTHDLDDDGLLAVYKEQCHWQRFWIPEFLTALDGIAQFRGSEKLQLEVAMQRSQGLKTSKELLDAFKELKFADLYNDNLIQLRQVEDEQVASAFTNRLEEVEHPERKQHLLDSFAVLAEHRDSDFLKAMLHSLTGTHKPEMTLERALATMEGALDTEDAMFLMLADFKAEEGVDQDTIKEALQVIAERKDSALIRHYLKTGQTTMDAWQPAPSVNPEIPVGLTNIANTCYLNSLLQYLFTVRELRDAVLEYRKPEQVATQELPRVGGRVVTPAEVERSRRFVELLQRLFQQLIHSPVNAVTPETELAYLALVPSKEEVAKQVEHEKADDASGTGDKVPAQDHAPTETFKPSEDAVSPSILGKRRVNPFDEAETQAQDVMIVDEQSPQQEQATSEDAAEGVADEQAKTPPSNQAQDEDERSNKRGRSIDNETSLETEMLATEGADGVTEIRAPDEMVVDATTTAPPSLPPRPTTADAATKERDLSNQVSNYMAFGRQNDVTECMDNVMFQLECAFNSATAQDASDVTAVLKKTFFGKTQQKLTFEDTSVSDPVRTRQEPFFSLLVDVAEEGRDMYDGLDAVFDDSVVEIEGQKARRQVSLVDVPDLLQVQLQRVQYDRVKQQIFKSNHYMAFGPELCLDRYLEAEGNEPDFAQRRDRTNELRAEIEALRTKLDTLIKPENSAKVLKDILHYTARIPELADLRDEQLAEDLATTAEDLEAEIASSTNRLQDLRREIESLWSRETGYGARVSYELVAVFMHRGTATSGHYFIYQRDSYKPDRWLKYNDATVTEVDAQQTVFAPTTGDTNAYFLVYCRKDKINAINSIARQIDAQ
ncbi:hypothetical protein ACM66B_001041 [Microbotryomycetes sp. NB124-2]